VKEWLKSVLDYRSYPKIKLGIRFFGPPCIAAKQRLQRVHSQCVNSGARLLPEYRVAR